jgi:acetyl esterase/lipase
MIRNFRFPAIRLVALLGLLLALGWASPSLARSLMDPFNVGPAMDGDAVKSGDGIQYAAGSPRKKLDVYTPKSLKGTAPVLFFIYGGGWDHGDRGDYQFVGQAFASRGFVVVIADYRLYPEVKFPKFLDDCAEALRWTQDNIVRFGGDPGRLFLAGHSAGAYNAVMLALDHSFFNDYAITMTIRGVAALSGPYNFYPFEYAEVQNTFGSAPNPPMTQPINLVGSDDPPFFLASGTNDPIVRIQNTQAMAQTLRNAGDWVTEKYYEGFGHMEPVLAIGAMWRWRAPVLDDMIGFFQQFGAFPGGVPRVAAAYTTPNAADQQQMQGVIAKLDSLMEPIGGGRRNE